VLNPLAKAYDYLSFAGTALSVTGDLTPRTPHSIDTKFPFPVTHYPVVTSLTTIAINYSWN